MSLPSPARSADRRPPIGLLLRFYLRLQFVQLRTAIEYSADFWIGIAGSALMHVSGLVFISALFSLIHEVEGWTVWEIALMHALALVARGFVEMACDGPWALRSLVNTGQCDRLLVQPVSASLQVATQIASVHGLGQMGLGIVVFAMASDRSALECSAGKALYLLVLFVSSAVMLATTNFLLNMIAFW